jgi:hypothetical protein
MQTSQYFSESYREARQKFINACNEAGASVVEHVHSKVRGVEGEELSCDVACIGPAEADKALLITSGTHGVEGFCGSGGQVFFLRSGLWRTLGKDVALVLVHSLNPYGFSCLRRVNEDNVDINRNFIDHNAPRPQNAAYDEIHELLLPSDWEGPAHLAADKAIAELIASRGARAVQAAITGGQYAHPDGLFYGGTQPVWSNKIWRSIAREHAATRAHVAFVDLHSGLGKYGYGEPIFRGRFENNGYARARSWYGSDVTSSEDGSSTSSEIRGNTASALAEEIGETGLTAVTLEFGTLPGETVLRALRADNWLHASGSADSPTASKIKAQIRDAFYCDNAEWTNLVIERAAEVFKLALEGLRQF